jgi:hypothetical protein
LCFILHERLVQGVKADVRIYVATFGADEDGVAFIQHWLAYAMQQGVLFCGSGGAAGRHAKAAVDHPPAAAVGHPLPAAVELPGSELEYWHASIAKNCSHRFAAEHAIGLQRHSGGGASPCLDEVLQKDVAAQRVASRCLLMCLDGDNVMAPGLSLALTNAIGGRWGCYRCSGNRGTTGRLGCLLIDFVELGGYDQEPDTVGSGSQDIDLINRLADKGKQVNGQKWTRNIKGLQKVGFAIPNSSTWEIDRGSAKVEFVKPSFCNTWAEHNKHNWHVMENKRKAGRLVRNNGWQHLGAWLVQLPLAPVSATAAVPGPSPRPSHVTPGGTAAAAASSSSSTPAGRAVADSHVPPTPMNEEAFIVHFAKELERTVPVAAVEDPPATKADSPAEPGPGEGPQRPLVLLPRREPVPMRNRVVVDICTFGLKFVGMEGMGQDLRDASARRHFKDLRSYRKSKTRTVPEDLLHTIFELLQDSEAAVDHPPASSAAAAATLGRPGLRLLAKDTRTLRAPHGAAKGHIGCHPGILASVVGRTRTSSLFAEWLGDLVAKLANIGQDDQAGPGNRNVLVALHDRHGKHQAPACANLLARMISHGQFRNVVIGRVRQLSSAYWADDTCGGCEACWASTPTRQQTYGRALRAWEQAWLRLGL